MSRKKVIIIISAICVGILAGLGFYETEENQVSNNTVEQVTENQADNQVKELKVTDEALDEAKETKEDVEKGKDVSTSENIATTDENKVEAEEATEQDAKVEQENISYDGDITGNGKALLGAYQGLTYYSQADSRWANVLYTSTGNRTQTMKSSACGPTSAAIVVSSSKGAILPTTMASLFVSNGYRTANNGTAWSAYSFVADYFGFNDYAYTSNLNTAISYLRQGYYVIASCGSGLFTTNGHYIVLVGIDGNTIKVYDPYLYNNKFNTASRRGKATVSGNTVYVSVANFRAYANSKGFWCYSNDNGNGNTSTATAYTRYVATQSSNLRVRSSAGGSIVGSLTKGSMVIVYETQGSWSRIGNNRWVSTAYLSASPVVTNTVVSKKFTTGTYKTTSNIHVRTGAGTNSKCKIKTYKQLTANARAQNKRLGNYYYNGYKKGVTCQVIKIKGNWGLTKSGWICLDYCKKI